MYILFDIGGTKTRVTASGGLESYNEPIKFDTPSDFDEGIDAIVEASWSYESVDKDRVDIQHVRREIRQLSKVSKAISIWLLLLSVLYCFVSLHSYLTLEFKDFEDPEFSPVY